MCVWLCVNLNNKSAQALDMFSCHRQKTFDVILYSVMTLVSILQNTDLYNKNIQLSEE